MSDRFDELSAFVEVARRRSFVGAAAQLERHVSAVSRAVAALEARLGVRLLQRTTRSVALTEAGRDYYQRGETLLAEFDGAEAAVRDLGASLRGTLRVSAASGSGVIQLAGLVPEFLAAHPHLHLDLQLTNRNVDLIEEGYDLAIRVGALSDSRLVARRLVPNRRVLVASPGYVERHGAPRRIADLQARACLVLDIGTHPQRWKLVRQKANVDVDADGPFRSNNVLALLQVCRGGAGIALLPEFVVAADVHAGSLCRLLPGWATPEHGVYAVYPTARFVPAKVRTFVDFIAQRLREPGRNA
jgi:DNA-binding transcriptional LysR family regulator